MDPGSRISDFCRSGARPSRDSLKKSRARKNMMVSTTFTASRREASVFRRGVFAVCLSLAGSGSALAEAGDPLTDSFSVGLGTFMLETSTRIRVDGTAGNGTEINTQRDLGLKDSDRFRVDAYWRFLKRHKIRLLYFDTKNSAERTLQKDL